MSDSPERARQVVVRAQGEAWGLHHKYIGTEHILLGLLCEEQGLAAHALESYGVSVEGVRAQVVRIVGSGEERMAMMTELRRRLGISPPPTER